jgi:hypothetical protein
MAEQKVDLVACQRARVNFLHDIPLDMREAGEEPGGPAHGL